MTGTFQVPVTCHPSPESPMKPIASLFSTMGIQWGLRGDPHLWREMEQYFAATPLPETVDELPPLIKAAFETLTGHPFSFDKHFFVDRYDSGGMSSGYISTQFWQERAIPLLCDRYEKAAVRMQGK